MDPSPDLQTKPTGTAGSGQSSWLRPGRPRTTTGRSCRSPRCVGPEYVLPGPPPVALLAVTLWMSVAAPRTRTRAQWSANRWSSTRWSAARVAGMVPRGLGPTRAPSSASPASSTSVAPGTSLVLTWSFAGRPGTTSLRASTNVAALAALGVDAGACEVFALPCQTPPATIAAAATKPTEAAAQRRVRRVSTSCPASITSSTSSSSAWRSAAARRLVRREALEILVHATAPSGCRVRRVARPREVADFTAPMEILRVASVSRSERSQK